MRRASPWPRRFLAAAARLAGVRVRGEGALAAPPVLLLANHVSWIDILALGGSSGSAFVAHSGLAAHPLLRRLCALNRTVFVERERRGAIAGEARALRAALIGDHGRGGVLTLFPEGTTGDGVTLGGFKSSLLAAVDPPPPGCAIQPVWLDYGVDAAAIAWVGREPGLANFTRILARATPITLTLRLLPPLADAERASRKTIAAAARAAIARAMRDQRVAL